jgi:small subunit ribosomal protein S8
MSFVNAPIHDLLIRIKNAYMARRTTLDWIVYSKFKISVLDLLKAYKFIVSYEVVEQGSKKTIQVRLKDVKDEVNDIPVIKFFSRPSRRWYISHKEIKSVAAGRGIWILSTSQWLLPTHVAKQKGIGWELIAEIY